jgi:hypothetical protein
MQACKRLKRFIFSSLVMLLALPVIRGQISFPAGSEFRYLKGKDAQYLSANWIYKSFDDSGWDSGAAPFRYGEGLGGTLLGDMQYNYSTVYLRSTFMAQRTDSLLELNLRVNYDDGFVIWINGSEVINQNAPVVLTYNGLAPESHESGQFEPFRLDPDDIKLVEGENILAIQAFNYNLESSDFYLDIEMNADAAEPVLNDTTGLEFSVPSGFYEDTFHLRITAPRPAWNVVYTLDGSNPQVSETAIMGSNSVSVLVDPTSYEGRPATPVFSVRASSAVEGIIPSWPEARTYIFLDEVMYQYYPGGDWPATNVNGQVIDLPMDQRITFHPVYGSQMVEAMTDIPSISIITDLDNLFDPVTGIYVNAAGHGFQWERECSVELVNPDGSEGFNVNAGLRIRGGWSRHPEFPKHAFRLFFRAEYGDAKLHFPLFGDEGVDRFDKVDLRCAMNWAWSHPFDVSRQTFLRDVFSRDLQGDMGQPYTRSRYYHLYLNGMYWGLYQTQERSEARFAADYLGGNTDDYDVVKVDTEDWHYQVEATDGYLDTWNELWDMCNLGFESNSRYFSLMGKDENGNPVPGMKVLVNTDNLIDYMITIFYTANFDAPTSSFGSNKGPNNFYAIRNREDPSQGFTFYNHDAEHSLFAEFIGPGQGLYEDRVNLAERTDGRQMEVSQFGSFHPQWLHYKLTANEEYRIRFRDRAFRYLEGDGILTPGENLARLNRRAAEIEMAIIGESARWGDAKSWVDYPETKNDHWIPEVNKIRNDFIPYRTEIVIDQLEEGGLYSYLEAPAVLVNGSVIYNDVADVNGPVSVVIENRNSTGEIWYTTNGSDPRAVGGSAAKKAIWEGSGQAELSVSSSAVIKSRIHEGSEWSALKEVRVVGQQDDYSGLAVTELHYHPDELVISGDTIPGKDLEFIEFKNTSKEAINLSGLVLDSAVYYEFPGNTLLAPGQFYVVASKPSGFFTRYGLVASGNFQNNLANEGEEVLLADSSGNPVIHFIYDDHAPWPPEADGEGYSLVSKVHDPAGNPAGYEYWRASTYIGGSPFKNDPFPVYAGGEEPGDEKILLYPNPTSGLLNIRFPREWAYEESSFQLYGISGNLVYSTLLSGNTSIHLDHLNLEAGVYMVRITGHGEIHTQKIVYNR